jgi:hypothetical protein
MYDLFLKNILHVYHKKNLTQVNLLQILYDNCMQCKHQAKTHGIH